MRSSADDKAIYNEAYYRTNLHSAHWFLNNSKKMRLRDAAVLRMLRPDSSMRVLDIGSAAGGNALLLAPRVRSVLGLDYSEQAVAAARQLIRDHAVSNADFIVDDATQMVRLDNDAFDAVTAIDFVEHINDGELALVLNALRHKLSAGGHLCVYTPSASHYVERLRTFGVIRQLRGHIAVRTFERLKVLFEQQGWEVQEYFFLPSTYPFFGWIDKLLHNVPLLGRWFCFRICFVAKVRSKGLS